MSFVGLKHKRCYVPIICFDCNLSILSDTSTVAASLTRVIDSNSNSKLCSCSYLCLSMQIF